MEQFIDEKYKEYKKKKIQSGYRCKTYLLSKKDKKLIYQVYLENTKYQAKKKKYVTDIIKANVNVLEIPNIFEYDENIEYSYLVTEYKNGIEMDKLEENKFNYKVFYEDLANILRLIHSIDVGNKFRVDREKWIRRKRILL